MIVDINFLESVSKDILNIKGSNCPMDNFAEDILYESIIPSLYTMKNKDGKLFLVYNQERGFVVGNIFFSMILVNFISNKNLIELKNNLIPINTLLFNNENVYIVLEGYNMTSDQMEESLYYRTNKQNLMKDAYPIEGTLLHPCSGNLYY